MRSFSFRKPIITQLMGDTVYQSDEFPKTTAEIGMDADEVLVYQSDEFPKTTAQWYTPYSEPPVYQSDEFPKTTA